jgi:hypothetical protein
LIWEKEIKKNGHPLFAETFAQLAGQRNIAVRSFEQIHGCPVFQAPCFSYFTAVSFVATCAVIIYLQG